MSEKATFGAGCFWCVEAAFLRRKGVLSVTSGYAGGQIPRPTYEEVCRGQTGHAEVIQVEYDPAIVSYEDLLEVFFLAHDPTTPNRQGNDIGPQYRSVILFHDDKQKSAAESAIARLEAAKAFDAKIVTEVMPLKEFYPAEAYHQDYFSNNPEQPYCAFVIAPKVAKIENALRSQGKLAEKP